MRQVLPPLSEGSPDHLGLAYDAWAPVVADGKVPDDRRQDWLKALSEIAVGPDYSHFFSRWKASFQPPSDRVFELRLSSRVLVGHGNSSATDVGLTVHHTWGVPVIPGSALKGLLANYVAAVYGPEDPSTAPWEQPEAQRPRVPFQGNFWREPRIQRGPGSVYRALFGAPEAEDDEIVRQHGCDAGALAGLITFHDALYVPDSVSENKPFAPDVLTVHQKHYYDSSGGTWPNDYDSPNPVAFLTVRPGARMLLALSGPPDWAELAERLLRDSLKAWGVGGKTSAGYGRLVGQAAEIPGGTGPGAKTAGPTRPRYKRGDRIVVTRSENVKDKLRFRADDGFTGYFANEEPPRIDVGETTQVWVAVVNLNPPGYTLTAREPARPSHSASPQRPRR